MKQNIVAMVEANWIFIGYFVNCVEKLCYVGVVQITQITKEDWSAKRELKKPWSTW